MSGQAEAGSAESSERSFSHMSASAAWDVILELGARGPGSLLVLDRRDADAFARSHVDGALHLTDARIQELIASTPKTATVVVYCYHGNLSQDIASLFGAFGFARAYSVDGGFEALAHEHAARKRADEELPELPRPAERYIVGDCVYARETIENDGGMPDLEPGARVATRGTRGIVMQVGHPEADPKQTVYAVRFEGTKGELGPVVGCLPEELTQEAPSP
jgi:nitrogen fixation protein NifZ